MDIGFKFVTSENPWGPILAKVQLYFSNFLAAQFLLITAGFEPTNRIRGKWTQICSQHPRKPMMICLLLDHGALLSKSPILINAAIRLVSQKDNHFCAENRFFPKKK